MVRENSEATATYEESEGKLPLSESGSLGAGVADGDGVCAAGARDYTREESCRQLGQI